MARRRKTNGRKRRTREHVIADLAVNYLERHVLVSGFTLQRIVHDYGLDAAVITYDRNGQVENGLVWVQVKATSFPQARREGSAIAVRVQRKDLLYWMGEQYPVVLVVYDAPQDLAYWMHVQNEFAGGKIFGLARAGASVTLQVPLERVLNREAVREFRRLKAEAQARWKKGAPGYD